MLEIVNLGRLLAGDDDTIQDLVRIASSQGVFFLDVRGPRGDTALKDKIPIIQAQRNFFGQDKAKKLAYVTQQENDGYEYCDELHVETLKLSRKQQIQNSLNLPVDLQPVQSEMSNLTTYVDGVLRQLSLLLCKAISPPISTDIVQEAKNPGRSNLCLGLAAGTPGTSLMERHVDSDLLTMTFYDEPFLEIQESSTHEWKVVDVCDNLPIVNVGTTFHRASGGRLRAPLHGVRQSKREINLIMYDLHKCEL